MFNIADLSFEVSDAWLKIDASGGGGQLCWSLSIDTAEQSLLGQKWKPRAYSQELFGLRRIAKLSDLKGVGLSWVDRFNFDENQEYASLYVFEHGDIYESELTFGLVEVGFVEIDWRAKCDVHFDSTYGEGLPLRINTRARFIGLEHLC